MSDRYQVFISFKNSFDGKLTRDHDIAKTIYDKLTAMGINVFYSEVSIQQKGNPSYMKVINKALEEASLMILVGTKREHIESKWVAQEWEAFISKMNSNPNSVASIVMALENMGPMDVPLLLANYQMYFIEDGYDQLIDFALNYFRNIVPESASSQPAARPASVPKDEPLDLTFITKEAESGDVASIFNLAKIYENGIGGVTKSTEKALYWYYKLADMNNSLGYYEIGMHYARGDGVEQSYEKAASYLMKCEGGDVTNAYYILGLMYAEGKGVPQSDKKAFECMKKGADYGNHQCEANLGVMYYKGEGCEQSLEKCVEYRKRAAEGGDPMGQYHLAMMYREGVGVPLSYEEAFKWTIRAAEGGEPDAQHDTGIMYLQGMGVEASPQKAAEWLMRARDNGQPQAAYHLAMMKSQGLI